MALCDNAQAPGWDAVQVQAQQGSRAQQARRAPDATPHARAEGHKAALHAGSPAWVWTSPVPSAPLMCTASTKRAPHVYCQ